MLRCLPCEAGEPDTGRLLSQKCFTALLLCVCVCVVDWMPASQALESNPRVAAGVHQAGDAFGSLVRNVSGLAQQAVRTPWFSFWDQNLLPPTLLLTNNQKSYTGPPLPLKIRDCCVLFNFCDRSRCLFAFMLASLLFATCQLAPLLSPLTPSPVPRVLDIPCTCPFFWSPLHVCRWASRSNPARQRQLRFPTLPTGASGCRTHKAVPGRRRPTLIS